MKNDTTLCRVSCVVCRVSCVVCVYYIYRILFISFRGGVEIRSNASPENRCRYRVMDDFNGLTVDDIITVLSDSWIVYIPFFEIDVDVVVTYRLRGVIVGNGSFPSWKNEFFRLDDNFVYFS